VVALDTLGNTVFRFQQADGSLTLPIMLAGRHHMLGGLVVIRDKTYREVVGKCLPVFNMFPPMKN
jgi:hypothetical protein